MHDIRAGSVSSEFEKMWLHAAKTLQSTINFSSLRWLRTEISDLAGEHLSFQAGNQVFFVRIFDTEERIESAGTYESFLRITESWGGVPCLMPMKCVRPTKWVSASDDPGLINAHTGKTVFPEHFFLSNAPQISEWELHDFAVQVVRAHIKNDLSGRIISYQSHKDIDPAIIFEDGYGSSAVIVRADRYPADTVPMPDNANMLSSRLRKGGVPYTYFASVAVMSSSDENDATILPHVIYRGDPLLVSFTGLEEV